MSMIFLYHLYLSKTSYLLTGVINVLLGQDNPGVHTQRMQYLWLSTIV